MPKGKAVLGVILIMACGLTLAWRVSVYALGLTTRFSQVTLENLETGKSYSTKELAGLPLEVVNTGKEPVDLKIELLLPEPGELKQGFQPIPDLSWIKLEKKEFKNILPNAAASTDVVINIPDEPRYAGKKYQLFIWTHTVGPTIGVGLKSKLLFTISKKKK